MKKVLVLECGLKPGWTKRTADMLAEELLKRGELEINRVNLRDEHVEACLGCALCLSRGEEYCKNHGDGAGRILEKMLWADGIIIVTPNYSLQVPANLKNLFDRLAYVFHRPRLFGRAFMPVTVQGVYAGGKINKYMNEVMEFWGCHTQKGTVIQGALRPNDVIEQAMLDKNQDKIQKAAALFVNELNDERPRMPSIFHTMIFRMTRAAMEDSPHTTEADKKYYKEKGWLKSKYYYDVRLGPIHAIAGAFGESVSRSGAKKAKTKLAVKS